MLEIKSRLEQLEKESADYEWILNKTNQSIKTLYKELELKNKRLAESESNLALINKRLEQSNVELEKFAYIASHDLQEPLRMISSFCSLLEKKYAHQLDSEAREYISFAVDGANRMKNLINALLGYAILRRKADVISAVNLNNVISKVLNDLNPKILESHANIKCSPLPTVFANEIQMYQLFLNLLSNALKYKGNVDPVIEVNANQVDEYWQFSVKDNGIGIKEEHFNKLFILFQRLPTNNTYQGVGIGLALCKSIVESYSGKMWLKSVINNGTTFYFTLKFDNK